MSEEMSGQLIAEQIRRTIDLLRAEIETLRAELEHEKELSARRLDTLEDNGKDHETRLRVLQEGVTTFKVWSGLASGGSTIVAVVAFVKAFIGIAP